MREFPAVGATQLHVFTAAQADAEGWTSHALRHAVTIGRLDRLRPGVYAPPVPASGNRFADAEQRLRSHAVAVALTNRGLTLSHAAAASLRGIALVEIPMHVCATTVRGRRGVVAGVHLHRAASLASDVQRRGPVLATSPARTVIDLGREHGVDASIAAGDSAVRLGLTTATQLAESVDRYAHWPGIAAARRAVSLVDPRAESVLESLSRLRIVTAGLPLPLTQAEICDSSGQLSARCDFYWPESGVIGEADGSGKYGMGDSTLRHEKIRQGLLEDLGLIVVRWGWSDLEPFAPTAARLRAAMARGARPDRAPRLWQLRPASTSYRTSAAS